MRTLIEVKHSTFWRYPNSITIFCSIFSLSLKSLAVIPLKWTKSWTFFVQKLSFINSIYISLGSIFFYISIIFSFENVLLSYHKTFAMFFIFFHLPKINSLRGFYNPKRWFLNQLFYLWYFYEKSLGLTNSVKFAFFNQSAANNNKIES